MYRIHTWVEIGKMMISGPHAQKQPGDPLEPLQQNVTRAENRNILLSQNAGRWGKTIRDILNLLAKRTWQRKTVLGVLSIRNYRYRHSASAAGYQWWVEHDLPGFDRFACEAFVVELVLTENDEPEFWLYTREAVYPLDFANTTELKNALSKAAQDFPKRIQRRMGVAKPD